MLLSNYHMRKPSIILYTIITIIIILSCASARRDFVVYRVRKGDTLLKISRKFNVPLKTIVKFNRIKNPNMIRIGDVIKIPRRVRKLIWPVKGTIVRNFNIYGGIRNPGIDIRVKPGTPVKASQDGVVVFVGDGVGSYGKVIILDHGRGLKTVYGYLDRIIVKKGDWVEKGEIIGYSGYDSITLEPMLHFEVRLRDVPKNPVIFLN